MRSTGIFAIALLAAALAAPQAAADIYVEQYSEYSGNAYRGQPASGLTRMWISEGKIRIEEPGGRMIHITDLNSGKLITLDTKERKYFVISLDQVRSDLERVSARMREQMKLSWVIERPAGEQEISGYRCRLVRFTGRGRLGRGGNVSPLEISIEFWVSAQAGVSIDIFLRLMDVIGLGENPFIDEQVIAELRRLGGYPIQTVTKVKMDGISDMIKQTVREMQEVEADSARFSIPAGYTRTDKPLQR